jgi:DNA invertase Pin-like site-specific DNA recombinase
MVRFLNAAMYTRQSSAANVGEDKHSEERQCDAISSFAKTAGYKIVKHFRDPAVSGRDHLINRPGFAAMMKFCEDENVHYVLVECGDRFARDLIVQELGLKQMDDISIKVVCADNPGQFTDPAPVARLVRQMLGQVGYDTPMPSMSLKA